MTSISRSRGRGWSSLKSEETGHKRPGMPIEHSKYNSLIDDINNLIVNGSIQMQKITEIIDAFIKAANDGFMVEVSETLYENALCDRQFGIKYAILFSDPKFSSYEKDNICVRRLLLNAMQNDFKNKDQVWKTNMTRFRNTVSFFGEIYYRLRLSGAVPVTVLALPLIQYLNMLLESATDEDVELVATQIANNGRNLYESHKNRVLLKLPNEGKNSLPHELDQLVMNVRKALINKNLSNTSRGMLLYVIDLANQRYTPISGELQEFYVSQLGCKTFISIQRHNKSLTIDTTENGNKTYKESQIRLQTYLHVNIILTTADFRGYVIDGDVEKESNNEPDLQVKDALNIKNDAVGILMRAPNQVGDNETETVVQRTGTMSISNTNSTASNAVPRAIRGSGAGDAKQKQKSHPNRRADNVFKAKPNSSNKGWGHDDRFDRDYE